MPTSPHYMQDCHPAEQHGRQLFLEELYRLSGRDRPNHPMHCLYTGLFQEMTKEQNQ